MITVTASCIIRKNRISEVDSTGKVYKYLTHDTRDFFNGKYDFLAVIKNTK